MSEKTIMRVDKELLRKLKSIRITERESYAEVVARLFKNKGRRR